MQFQSKIWSQKHDEAAELDPRLRFAVYGVPKVANGIAAGQQSTPPSLGTRACPHQVPAGVRAQPTLREGGRAAVAGGAEVFFIIIKTTVGGPPHGGGWVLTPLPGSCKTLWGGHPVHQAGLRRVHSQAKGAMHFCVCSASHACANQTLNSQFAPDSAVERCGRSVVFLSRTEQNHN